MATHRQTPSYQSDVELLFLRSGELGALESGRLNNNGSTVLANKDVSVLSWHNLTVTVKDRATKQQREILSNASGFVHRGEMMALMGPSGSGKTTLLNTIAQRAQPGKVSGKVLVNGTDRPFSIHRKISSFVEQEDTLIGSLTVEESLHFAARLALPKRITRTEARARVSKLIGAFGLTEQRHTLIGTPLQKGISGGQKRRVSVATQLVTQPRVLYLDEPTSGLDSTASYEVMSFISDIASEFNLIVIASIHQPSTKTFELFNKVVVLSQGQTCYNGPVFGLPQYLHDMSLPIPELTNPAEYILDLVNLDFAQHDGKHQLQTIFDAWDLSKHNKYLEQTLSALTPLPLSVDASGGGPSLLLQIMTLLHRAFIKSYRDLVAYWIRVVMYLGLAIMMGTVWLRLSTDQSHIQPFINAIFFGSAFMSFMAVAYVPAFLEDRAIFVKERANGLYGPTAFLVSNFIIGLPYLFLISVLFSIVSYWLINFQPTARAFFTWVMWLFLDLLAAESLVVLVASLMPNFVVALAVIAFANGLWMSVGGFLVSPPTLNVFWRYVFHYIDYQAYVFQGMMVNEFKSRTYKCSPVSGLNQCHCLYPSHLQDQCKIAGSAVLNEYGYETGREAQWVGIMISIIAVYRLLGWVSTWIRER